MIQNVCPGQKSTTKGVSKLTTVMGGNK